MIEYIENPVDFTKKLLDLMNEFGKRDGNKVNTQIIGIPVHQQRNFRNRNQEKKNPIWYSNKKNKIPGNKPNQGGKRPVLRKLHNTEKEIKEDTNKWKHVPCSWIGRINIIKMSIPLKVFHRFNAIPVKIRKTFHRYRRNIWKIYMEP